MSELTRAWRAPAFRADLVITRIALVSLAVICTVGMIPLANASAAPADQGQTFQIGVIDYFGYAGINLSAVEKRLPIRVGDQITFDSFDHDTELIQRAVRGVIQKPATDVEAVCCDQNRRMLIYIGLDGTSSRRVPLNPEPKGDVHLGEPALQLYESDMAATASAVQRGASGEDHSKGYALSSDPAARKIQLEIHGYALEHTALLERVLAGSADDQQRRVTALFLGYARRSPQQIQSLSRAVLDHDSIVRNNAIRSLWALASAKNAEPIRINPAPLIDLLFSGDWSDRNKSSLLLVELTRQRDTRVLAALRKHALQPLLEGARWKNTGHSWAFLMVLGRIEGIPESRLRVLASSSNKSQILDAAEKLLRGPN